MEPLAKILKAILLLVTLFITSCEDMLEREPKEFLSPTSFSSEEDIIQALTGAYRCIVTAELVQSDFITDYGFMDKSWAGMVDFWDQGQNTNSLIAESKWTRLYQGILRANTVLAYIDQTAMPSSEIRERYRAEARFLRAFFYSKLILFYGDVPFRTFPEGLAEQLKPRTSENEIKEFIYAELDSAMRYLPLEYDFVDNGRATKGAAQTLMAWVALNYYDYDITITMADSVINSGVYELYTEYADLLNSKTEGTNREVIFDIQYMDDKRDEGLSDQWTVFFQAWGSYMSLYNMNREYYMNDGLPADATNPGFDPEDPFKNRDPRLYYTLVVPYSWYGINTNGDTVYYIPKNQGHVNFASLKIRKYVDYEEDWSLRGKGLTGTNIIYFRYADLLLMKAEALCELDGSASEQEIINLVNQVRHRPSVMMPGVEFAEGTGLSQDQLREIVRHERKVELAYEGSRFHDIRRWDIGEEAFTDAWGYEPWSLGYYTVIESIIEEMENDGVVPSSMIRYLKREDYFLNMDFVSEADFREYMATVFTPDNRFDENELEIYGDAIVDYVKPKYVPYSFRQRTFNMEKGYLWPIPFIEMQSNELIGANNPGYY
jgi:starch-binding outer membrane protein, SusD/RagB family